MDELLIDGQVYVPTKRAAAITGYAKDYIGQLCREGRIEAKLVGRSWYVLETSLREHRFGGGAEAVVSEEQAPVHVASAPEVLVSPIEEWQSPSYTPEPLEEVLPALPEVEEESQVVASEPLEALPHVEETVPQVQDAWQEWFAKTKMQEPVVSEPLDEAIPAQSLSEEVQPEEESVSREEAEVPQSDDAAEAPAPVRLIRNVPGSMDIGFTKRVEAISEEPEGVIIEERRIRARHTRLKASKMRKAHPVRSYTVLKAVLVGLMLITLSVAVIGTGALQVFSPSWAASTPVIDFIAGVKNIDK